MKVVIIEDEKLAAERLVEMLNEIDSQIEIIGTAGSIRESINLLNRVKPDILFLDIQLSDGLSFEIFEEITQDTPIIFTTAYDNYAIKAFKLNSVDYLLKPIKKDELKAGLEKYKTNSIYSRTDFNELLSIFKSNKPVYKQRYLVQYGSKVKAIEVVDAAYFWAMEKSVFVTMNDGMVYPIESTLDGIVEEVNPEKFFRINRKMVVSFECIKTIIPFSRSRFKLELNPKEPKEIEALVSVERAADFKKWLNK